MNIPRILGHQYQFHSLLDISTLHTTYATHRRLRVFHHKGLKCVNDSCDKEGKYLIKAMNKAGGFHVDLYTDEFELMTIDHIVPRSKGGKDELENLQPMCNTCNAKKADKV
jgi:5-methylcytosine-specific restriction endonuclease McrA